MTFEPRCLATGIGSLPHADASSAIALVAETIGEIPYVPQLPNLGWHEGMMVQYTEGLPGRVLDEDREKIHLDIAEQGILELEAFYMRVIEDDPAAFAVSDDHLHGLTPLLERLGALGDLAALKTQVTGPITQGLSTIDQGKRAVFYDPTFQEVVVKNCAMKARWTVRQLASHHSTVICFLDEPILTAFGSSVYVSIQRDDVIAQLQEVAAAIRAEGALCGVHCCGHTDWTLLTDAGVDVLSFDAFEFAYSLPLYPKAIGPFVERGGIIAWGIVPTSEVVEEHSVDSLEEKLKAAMAGVEDMGVSRDRIMRQALLTPACGLGSVSVEQAEIAFRLLAGLSRRMREQVGA